MSDVDCGHWAEAETTTAPLPAACRHCDVAVVAVSVGYVHADTHNTRGVDGHRAEAAFDAMLLTLPTENDTERGVTNAPYTPVSAASVIADHHDAYRSVAVDELIERTFPG